MTEAAASSPPSPSARSGGRVCVIGAGSSGITALKTLAERGIDVVCFERGSGIGGNWRFRNDNGMSSAYASLHINTSKERMAYADYPMPRDFPDYPHHSQILSYFEEYVDHFGVRDRIRFGTTVRDVEPVDDDRWRVTVAPTDQDAAGDDGAKSDAATSEVFDAVLVANGHHWSPRLPELDGSFDGEMLHSHDYKTPDAFAGRRVMVMGIGNSAVDIASELSRVAARTVLSTRRSAHILPKYALGRPIDHFTSPSSSRLPLKLQELGFKIMLAIARGPQQRFGVRRPDHGLLQAHPTISAELLNLVGHGKIAMKPDVQRLDGDGVRFVDGSREALDALVLATGYRIRFPFLDETVLQVANNDVQLYRHVAHPRRPNLYFIGLVQPLGAIMPLAEAQSKWVAALLCGEATLPSPTEMESAIQADRATMRRRYVTSDRHTIQVDFYPYLRQLDREMAAA